MTRLLPTLVVLGLLGGSAAAFAVTEGLKLERSPITGTRISTSFSPTCRCPTRVARIAFRLRKADTVTAAVLDSDGETVQTIVSDLHATKGFLTLHWNGRNESGAVVPQGGYKVRVHLARRHQSITLPNTIEVDMTPPRIVVSRIRPHAFSPDQDGRRDRIVIHFRVSEQARPLLFVDGKEALRGRLADASGTLYWAGRVAGRLLPAGTYGLTLRASDVAGNTSAPSRVHRVQLRYVDIARPRIHARAGRLFAVRVFSDARRLRWQLDGRSGLARPANLKLRAPRKPGRYLLVVGEGGHSSSAYVIVGQKR